VPGDPTVDPLRVLRAAGFHKCAEEIGARIKALREALTDISAEAAAGDADPAATLDAIGDAAEKALASENNAAQEERDQLRAKLARGPLEDLFEHEFRFYADHPYPAEIVDVLLAYLGFEAANGSGVVVEGYRDGQPHWTDGLLPGAPKPAGESQGSDKCDSVRLAKGK
jgi:hypothetical protein